MPRCLRCDVTSSERCEMAREDIKWLSTPAAAGRLGVRVRTLYRLIDAGQIPAYKFGRVIRLQEAEVDAFVQSARIQPGELEHLYAAGGTNGDED